MKTYKGYFNPKNPKKYRGDPRNIIYRSRWESIVMDMFDRHPDVIEWSSEEIVIPYRSPVDGRMHRYFVDFYVKKRTPTGKIETSLVEVKPLAQTKPPILKEGKSKMTRNYVNAVMTWGVNSSKWEAAEKYCNERDWSFVIITEKELGLNF